MYYDFQVEIPEAKGKIINQEKRFCHLCPIPIRSGIQEQKEICYSEKSHHRKSFFRKFFDDVSE